MRTPEPSCGLRFSADETSGLGGLGGAYNVAIVKCVVDREKLDPKFLKLWLKSDSFQKKVTSFGGRAAQAGFNKSDLRELDIPLPPLAEQKRIAGILDAADALRAKRRAALAQLDTLLQSTFLYLFDDPVTNPKGWEVQLFGTICDVRDGTHDSPKYVQDGRPLLTSKNFKDGRVDYSGANLVSERDFVQINKRSKVDVGDLVMPMIGTIGNPVLIEAEPDFVIKNVALIKFGDASPDCRFIRSLLCSHYFDHVTSKSNRGGTQKFVALKDLRALPIPLPPLPLQRQFAEIVASVERQKARMRAHLAELDTLFASLQQRAFRGEL
ncbi:MAG: restriction endonuclease subunit S [Opitutales bacterium]